MSISCKNSGLGCTACTMQREQDDGLPYECDACWIVRDYAQKAHYDIQEIRDETALDGDDTETLSKVFLNELDALNGNK